MEAEAARGGKTDFSGKKKVVIAIFARFLIQTDIVMPETESQQVGRSSCIPGLECIQCEVVAYSVELKVLPDSPFINEKFPVKSGIVGQTLNGIAIVKFEAIFRPAEWVTQAEGPFASSERYPESARTTSGDAPHSRSTASTIGSNCLLSFGSWVISAATISCEPSTTDT